mmetsp:Transcript_37131/g.81319  ORF Transcript_37131/g.81319 Transcript_37131/m.81319 type:complete len:239 (-) Transcript_37131:1169-1885(-)
MEPPRRKSGSDSSSFRFRQVTLEEVTPAPADADSSLLLGSPDPPGSLLVLPVPLLPPSPSAAALELPLPLPTFPGSRGLFICRGGVPSGVLTALGANCGVNTGAETSKLAAAVVFFSVFGLVPQLVLFLLCCCCCCASSAVPVSSSPASFFSSLPKIRALASSYARSRSSISLPLRDFLPSPPRPLCLPPPFPSSFRLPVLLSLDELRFIIIIFLGGGGCFCASWAGDGSVPLASWGA